MKSIALGHTRDMRPSMEHSVNQTTGEISVVTPPGFKPVKVVLRHAQTMQATRRDFRWVRKASNITEPCRFPEYALKKPVFGGGNCVVPIFWHEKTMKASADGIYRASPPDPSKKGHWTGYYVEVYFASDSGMKEYRLTTAGYAWPNTLPYKDCNGTTCTPRLV